MVRNIELRFIVEKIVVINTFDSLPFNIVSMHIFYSQMTLTRNAHEQMLHFSQ